MFAIEAACGLRSAELAIPLFARLIEGVFQSLQLRLVVAAKNSMFRASLLIWFHQLQRPLQPQTQVAADQDRDQDRDQAYVAEAVLVAMIARQRQAVQHRQQQRRFAAPTALADGMRWEKHGISRTIVSVIQLLAIVLNTQLMAKNRVTS
jgi:hypothetical protein